MKTLLISFILFSLFATIQDKPESKDISKISNDFHVVQNVDKIKDIQANTHSKKTIDISKDSALDVVLKDANLSKNDISNLKIELDDYSYDIEFNTDQNRYDYEVSISSSKITKKEIDKIVKKQSYQQSSDIISKELALSIALDYLQLSKNQIRDLEIELDKNIYEIDFDANGYEYSFDIHSKSEKIIEFEKDK